METARWKVCARCGTSVRYYGPRCLHSCNRYKIPLHLRIQLREALHLCPRCWTGYINSADGRNVLEYIRQTCEVRVRRRHIEMEGDKHESMVKA